MAGCMLLLIGLVAHAFVSPVSQDALTELRPGMTPDEFRVLLGSPSEIDSKGQWTYSKALVFGYVTIHWRADGTYDGEYNFERF